LFELLSRKTAAQPSAKPEKSAARACIDLKSVRFVIDAG
jgi:hypothetical protein